MTTAQVPTARNYQWPEEGVIRVPFWVYSDPQVYEQEMRLIFCGETWAYVGLEVEIPPPGDFKQVTIGDRPVVLVRDAEGDVRVFVNRCMHRGVKFCRVPSGHVQHFTCPYHQWTYDLQGRLRGVPFHRGVKHQGGMPADCAREVYGLEALQVTARHYAMASCPSPTQGCLGHTTYVRILRTPVAACQPMAALARRRQKPAGRSPHRHAGR